MSISDNYVPIRQLGNGVTTQFSSNWAMLAAAYAAVFLEDVTTGVQTAQVLGVDYTLVFDSSGFTVTFIVAPPSTKYAVVGRSVSNDQTDPYRTSKGFQGEVIEASFDKLTAIAQDLSEASNRAFKFQLGSTAVGVLPTPVDDTVLAWSGTSGAVKNGPTTASLTAGATNAAASAAAASSSASAASGSATSAAASAITAQAAAAGMQYRASRAGSTANVNIASAPSTLDGVTLVSLDRVLLQNQSTASQNGLYQFNGAGSAMTRTTDFNTWAQVPGTVVVVEEGTVNGDKVFLCTSNVGGTIGSTAITFVNWSAVIFNNSITNTLLALMTANSIKAAGSSGAASDIAIALNQLMGRGASGDVAAITLGTGLVMTGTTLSANAVGGLLRRTIYSSSSGTWTRGANTNTILVKTWGAGGGATGSGGSTTFDGLTAGGGGVISGTVNGGTASGGDLNFTGGAGNAVNASALGGPGGSAPMGGQGGIQGQSGLFPGGGCGATGANSFGAGGGAYCEKLYTAPASASYSVGAGGTGSLTGGGGLIIVEEYA